MKLKKFSASGFQKMRVMISSLGTLKKTGLFSVKSAYKLAVEINTNDCSTSISADRRNFEAIWTTPVPQKIKVFTWKLARNGLAVQTNRLKRHLIPDATCPICGLEPESEYHAMVRCTKAVALRQALRQVWDLPGEPSFIIQDLTGCWSCSIALIKKQEPI